LGAKQESFVDSHEEFKEATRQKLARLELNSNWGGELNRISQRLDHIEDRQIIMESRATGVPVEAVVKTYYNAPLAEDDDKEETYEVVEFEDAPTPRKILAPLLFRLTTSMSLGGLLDYRGNLLIRMYSVSPHEFLYDKNLARAYSWICWKQQPRIIERAFDSKIRRHSLTLTMAPYASPSLSDAAHSPIYPSQSLPDPAYGPICLLITP